MIAGDDIANGVDRIDFGSIVLRDEYLDANGHLNTGYYTVLMDQAAAAVFTHLGMGWEYSRTTQISQFSLGSSLMHYREVRGDMPLGFRFHLVDVSEKLVHFHITMTHAVEGWEAASFEGLNICMDLSSRRPRVWPEPLRNRFDMLHDLHRQRPTPRGLGQKVAIRR